MKIKSEESLLRTTDVPDTFLQKGISLSDEEKLRNFAEMKKLCEEMEEKAVCYQRRCDYIQGQVKLSEQEKSQKKKKKSTKGKVYTPNFDSSLFEVIEEFYGDRRLIAINNVISSNRQNITKKRIFPQNSLFFLKFL